METIWWNQVTNATKFIADITKCILEEKSILLKYASNIPWRDQFVSSIIEIVKCQNGEKKFVEINCVDNPGNYLLNEFCMSEKRSEFRPSKGYARFFAESDDIVIHDRYLWITVDNPKSLDAWLNFASEYIKERGKKLNNAVFIIEMKEDSTISKIKGIRYFSLDEYINEYDRMVFAVLASSQIKERSFIKTYLAELVANLAGNDIELAATCIMSYNVFLENPSAYMEIVYNTRVRSNGEKYVYKKSAEEVKHLIWLSQIKTIYPYLEEYREGFVNKYSKVIANQLPIKAPYGEIYDDPNDVELGTLLYMVGSGCIILNPLEYDRLKNFKEARNKLSHLTVLSMEEIEKLQ